MSDFTNPEPVSYADALRAGLVAIRDHINEWSREEEREHAGIPLAGGWVHGLIDEQIHRLDTEPNMRDGIEVLGPGLIQSLQEQREREERGNVRGEH